MSHFSKLTALAFAALLGTASASAVPAKPGLMRMQQPDGTTVTVRLVGDENFHYYLSEAGQVLAPGADGVMRYATVDANSRVVAGPVKATEQPTAQIRSSQPAIMDALRASSQLGLKRTAQVRPLPTARGGSFRAPSANPSYGLFDHQFPVTGSPKGLVILVEYSDVKFKTGDPYDYFSRMMHETGFSDHGGTGCVEEYFANNSLGQFTPEFDVLGPVTLPKTMAYYGGNNWAGNDQHPEQMAIDALNILDDEVDFSQYDTNGDGYIDNVFIFYAGMGEASGGASNTVWPHSWNVTYVSQNYYDGVLLDRYACSNEWDGSKPDGMGTFVHEFSHVMGLPDLYATSYTGAFTPGSWSAMDEGPYNNDGRTPPDYGAFERFALGWVAPEEINGPLNGRLQSVISNESYIIPTAKDTEFFLLDNRQQVGNDRYVPGHGMLVWHIDYNQSVWDSNTVNNSASHQYVDIEEADGTGSEYSRDGDAFPGTSHKTSFTDNTTPNMKTWAKKPLGLPITDIAEANGIITFKVSGGVTDVDVPQPVVAHVGADEFTANWEPAEGGLGYRICVYTKKTLTNGITVNKYLASYDRQDLGPVTEVTVTGLEPETDYFFTVRAYGNEGEGDPCGEIAVTTTPRGYRYHHPVALEATEVGEHEFTANWEALEGATAYSVQLYTKQEGGPVEAANHFNFGADDLKEGWTSSSSATYAMASYCGEATPSLRLGNSQDYLQTPAYGDGLKTLKFWHRGSNTGESATITVEAFDGSDWNTVQVIPVVKTAGGQTTELAMPEEAIQARLTFDRGTDGKGALAIDDVVVGHGTQVSLLPVAGKEDIQAGSALSLVIEGLEADTDYCYTVRATDGTEWTYASNEIHLHTTGVGTGIETVASTQAGAMYYDLQGRRVAAPTHGIYIQVRDGKSRKVRF